MEIATDRRLFLGGVVAFAALPGASLTEPDLTDPAAIQAHVEGLIHEFLGRMPGTQDLEAPSVNVAFTPGLSWMSSTRPHVMHIAAWEQCPPPVQAFFASVQDNSAGGDAADFYRAGFYNFLIPHEMSHFVDYQRGQGPTASQRYESELRANRVAIAFWMGRPGGLDWLTGFVPQIEAALARLPIPVPAGADATAYFNANYQTLLANPVSYAWFQWRMVLDAWARRDEADFATLIGRG
ncbi:MAG: hypothetical protein EON91_05815 [Brevundimonas sp.]|uniref:hypothetical protein n=1 Tax=Brevundimonas sp. TaxID=1871086 RepID=UPI00121B4025|nr:hypothetical protein [Brevundimonas sp.]RZJ18300.1 MAG: hypothetical protein EON91_05815 [Brevundimonas sp.]